MPASGCRDVLVIHISHLERLSWYNVISGTQLPLCVCAAGTGVLLCLFSSACVCAGFYECQEGTGSLFLALNLKQELSHLQHPSTSTCNGTWQKASMECSKQCPNPLLRDAGAPTGLSSTTLRTCTRAKVSQVSCPGQMSVTCCLCSCMLIDCCAFFPHVLLPSARFA